jgi:hypothetical protein
VKGKINYRHSWAKDCPNSGPYLAEALAITYFDLDRRQSSGRKFRGKPYHALRQSDDRSSAKFVRLVILHNLNFATQKKVGILKLLTKFNYFFADL